jgi:acetate kinase
MSEALLVVNAGSSSVKFSVFETEGPALRRLTAHGEIDGIGTHPRLTVREVDGGEPAERILSAAEVPDHRTAIGLVRDFLHDHLGGLQPLAVGHRVVHGGTRDRAVRIDATIIAELDALTPLAPLHQPHALAAIRSLAEMSPELPQIACFDTAFHRGHPQVADLFALPWEYYEAGVRRYGFHGLSYEYIARTLPEVAPEIAGGRIVVAHLGSGASLCAIKAGRSIDSTMGFTALDGLPMGTRTGALDPGVILYLLQARGMDAKAIETLLYKKSGLLGLSGISNDMRDLLESREPHAEAAIDYFVYRVIREIGALTAALGGLDALVFTAGIGEHAPQIRHRICEGLAWLGLALDPAANAAGKPRITAAESRVSAWIIPTDEEKMIALHTLDLMKRHGIA